MIDNEVVYQQAQKEKIKVTDDEVNQKYSQIEKMLDTNQEYKKLLDDAGVDEDYLKETIKKDLAVQKYRENYEQDLKVTDKEVEKYYKEHKDDFKEESVEAYHILVSTLDDNNKPVDDSKKEELKSKAESLLKEIKKDHILIFSTHILQLAIDLCDELVILKDGKLSLIDNTILKSDNFENEIMDILKEDIHV